MTDDSSNKDNDDLFTEEGRLRHEINYLQERLTNLEVFKKNFFIVNSDLIRAREKLAQYEEQFSMEELKERILGLSDEGLPREEAKANDDLLEFFEESLSAASYQDLVMSIFQSLADMGLEIAVQIKHGNEYLDYALEETIKVKNISLINKHKTQGEQIEYEQYIVFNEDYISIIANNLPLKHKIKCEQIKKYLKLISIGANARIHGLSKQLELENLRDNIYKIFRMTHQSFDNMRDNMDEQIIAVSTLFVNLRDNIKNTMDRMEFSDEYRKLVGMILEDARNELNLMLTSSLSIDERFLATIIKLEKAYSKKLNE